MWSRPATGVCGSWAAKVALAVGSGRVVAVGRNKEVLGELAGFDPIGIKTQLRSRHSEKDQAAIVKTSPWSNSNGADLSFDWTPVGALDASHFTPCLQLSKKAVAYA